MKYLLHWHGMHTSSQQTLWHGRVHRCQASTQASGTPSRLLTINACSHRGKAQLPGQAMSSGGSGALQGALRSPARELWCQSFPGPGDPGCLTPGQQLAWPVGRPSRQHHWMAQRECRRSAQRAGAPGSPHFPRSLAPADCWPCTRSMHRCCSSWLSMFSEVSRTQQVAGSPGGTLSVELPEVSWLAAATAIGQRNLVGATAGPQQVVQLPEVCWLVAAA